MRFEPTSLLCLLGAITPLASAHSTVWSVWINGKDQGLGNFRKGYIRSPPTNNPIQDVTSRAMTCNVNNKPTRNSLTVSPGDKVSFEWHHDSRGPTDEIIASSHRGPIMTYIAPIGEGSQGKGWVKIAEDAYRNGEWATDRLRRARGIQTITLPEGLAPGQYLLRPEILALHNANYKGGIQVYTECVQIKVKGGPASSGGNGYQKGNGKSNGEGNSARSPAPASYNSKNLPAGVSLPGAYSPTQAGILYNLYATSPDYSTYQIPGPKPWSGANPRITYGGIGGGAPGKGPNPKSFNYKGGSGPGGGNHGGKLVLKKYSSCGGSSYTGPGGHCEAGTKCVKMSQYYSQCQ